MSNEKTTKCPTAFEDLKPFSPLEVRIGRDQNFEYCMKIWKSMVQKSRILTDYKESCSYEKPSDKKRRKHRESIERQRQTLLREKQIASGEFDKIQKKKEARRESKRAQRQEQREKQAVDSGE